MSELPVFLTTNCCLCVDPELMSKFRRPEDVVNSSLYDPVTTTSNVISDWLVPLVARIGILYEPYLVPSAAFSSFVISCRLLGSIVIVLTCLPSDWHTTHLPASACADDA